MGPTDSISQIDGMFLENVDLDNSFSISDYESYTTFGYFGQPMIPYLMKKGNLGFSDLLKLSNINRYSIIKLRYLGHRVEMGNKWNGSDYYSLLNPSLKTNYKETYFSDRFNMFQNKLLFYYKQSKITEGLYEQLTNPIEVQYSLFNIALYPGTGLSTFNFAFIQSDRNNNIDSYKTVIDTLFYNNNEIDSVFSEIIDNRIDIASRQFNISMTNPFKLWVNQILGLNILLFDQVDRVAKNVSSDSLLSIGYLSKDASSQSYGINLKSIYNNHWESNLFFNISNYSYTQIGFEYNDNEQFDDDQKQEIKNYQFRLIYYPVKYFKKFVCGLKHSIGRGTNYFTQYSFNMGITSEPIDGLYLNMLFNYRVKYLGGETKSPNDIFCRAQIMYDIL